MLRHSWALLGLLGAGCSSTPAEESTQDEDIAALKAAVADLQVANATLAEDLTTANAALTTLRTDHDALVQHERALAAEVVNGEPFDEQPAFQTQLDSSRLDSLGAPEIAALTTQVATIDASLTALTEHEHLLAEHVTGHVPVATDLALFRDQLEDSRIVALEAADSATTTALSGLSTAISAGDAQVLATIDGRSYATTDALGAYVQTTWLNAQGYATTTVVTGAVDGLRQDVLDAHYLTASDLTPLATDADLQTVSSNLAGLTQRVDEIQADYLVSTDVLGLASEAWVNGRGFATASDLASVDARVNDILADYVTVSDLDPIDARLNAVDTSLADAAFVIASDRTIHVPSEQPTIQAALDSLQNAVIHARTRVDIVVDPAGCVEQQGPIVARHRDGARIHIRSATGDPNQCVLTFPEASVPEDNYGGVLIKQGYVLGELSGFTLRGPTISVLPALGLTVDNHAALLSGGDLIVEGWNSSGVGVTRGSFLSVERPIVSTGNGGHGFVVFGDAVAYFPPGTGATSNELNGMFVGDGGVLYADETWSAGNGIDGYHSQAGGVLYANRATTCDGGDCGATTVLLGNAEVGFDAIDSGFISAVGARSAHNGDGFQVSNGSTVRADGAFSQYNRYGYLIGTAGLLTASNMYALNNTANGIYASQQSAVHAIGSSINDNGAGVTATEQAWVEVGGSDILRNSGVGISARYGGLVEAGGCNVTANNGGNIPQPTNTLDAEGSYIAWP